MNLRLKNIHNFCLQQTSRRDFWIALCFTIFLTFQPTLFIRPINFFELGLYLPGIQALENGLSLYKDVFHLRGPLDIVWPWVVMHVWGMQIQILESYFYICSVVGILLAIYLGWEFIRHRFVFWFFVPVVIARTFPKVVVAYWGGMRFVLGLLTVTFLIRYLKNNRKLSLFMAGLCSALALMTSLDVGAVSLLTLLAFILISHFIRMNENLGRMLIVLGLGYLVGLGSVLAWLVKSGALRDFIDCTSTIVFHMRDVVVQTNDVPKTWWGFFGSLVNPAQDHFKHFTPFYLYVLVIGLFVKKMTSQKITNQDISLFVLIIYGLFLFFASFQNIEAAHFEMALQPEKILLFFCLGVCLTWLTKRGLHKKFDKIIFIIVFLALGISSWGFSLSHMVKKFDVARYVLKSKKHNDLSEFVFCRMDGLSGLRLPTQQAKYLENLKNFIDTNTHQGNRVLMFPEMGSEYFLMNRSWIGRFPVASFTWFNDAWHREWMENLKQNKPEWVVLPYEFDSKYEEIYFKKPANRIKCNEVLLFVAENYRLEKVDAFWRFYKRK